MNSQTNYFRQPRLKKAKRDQVIFQTLNIERLVDDDHSVRAIWEFVGSLNLEAFMAPIRAVAGVAGRNAIDPQILISLWIYAYSRGVSSAREIASLCEYNPAFQWLTGMQVINHHTLSDFRVGHKQALDELFAQVLGVLSAGDLITLKTVMQDGTKIRASAGQDSFRGEDKIREHIKIAEEVVKKMDNTGDCQLNKRKEKARKKVERIRKHKLELALKELQKVREQKPNLKARREARVSETDPESRVMKQADGGYRPSYNVQIATDQANGLIVGIQPTQETNDCRQLIPAVDMIEKNTGRSPDQIVADGGYTNRENIMAIDQRRIDFIGSFPDRSDITTGQLKRRGIDPAFSQRAFSSDRDQNTLTCPAGKLLEYKERRTTDIGVIESRYQARLTDCAVCRFKDKCCPRSLSKGKGRSVTKRLNHPVVEAFISKMRTTQSKDIYKQRGAISEFPNAWIKEKIGLRQFRLRGMLNVGTECTWAALTYNIQRWIQLVWRPPRVLGVLQ